QRLVRRSIDLAAEDLLGALHRERGHLAAQFGARTVSHVVDVGLRLRLLACRFQQRIGTRLVDDLRGLLVGPFDHAGRFGARVLHLCGGLVVGGSEFLARTVGRFQPFGDPALAFLDRIGQRRPHELDRDRDHDQERDHFADHGCIDFHRYAPATVSVTRMQSRQWGNAAAWVKAEVSSGLANAKNIAMARLMKKSASIRPTSRNMRPVSIGLNSGWRAIDSMYFEPMTPMPMQAPSAPRPIMRPAAMAV